MTTVELPYLWMSKRRGKPAAYYRRAGKFQRIRGPGGPVVPGDAAFLSAYEAIHAAAGKVIDRRTDGPSAGSLAALVDEFRASPEWRDLAPATRKDYDKALVPLRAHRAARLPVRTLPRAFVFRLRDEFATGGTPPRPTPRRANRMVNVLRLLLQWAVDRGWRRDNPALRPGRLRTGPGYRRWTAADLAAFLEHPGIGEPLKRAAALGYYTGQRKQDCLALTKAARRWNAEAGWEIEVVPEKTRRSVGARLHVPEHPELTRILNAAPPSDAVTLLTRPDGRPWVSPGRGGDDHFNHEFADAVKLAGLPAGTSFHGLNKALVADLAESGASDAEIDAVRFHADPAMTRHYRAEAGQRELARSAMRKLERKGKV